MLSTLVRAAAVLAGLAAFQGLDVEARRTFTKADLRARQEEAVSRLGAQRRAEASSGGPGTVKNITFTNPRASGESELIHWGGLVLMSGQISMSTARPSHSSTGMLGLDIGGATDSTAAGTRFVQLFFWFFPPGPEGSLEDLVFWTNGGPGCSSLEGLLQENGPISWSWGQAKATPNQYSWTNLSSILYVEQPVGTGFSQGTPDINNEDELAEQLVGFFQQFFEVFSELQGKNFYLTGESYAGTYVPYIANYIYDNPDSIPVPLKGFWISDPSVSWDVVQEEIPAVAFVHKYENVFALNQTFMEYLDQTAASCGYTGYMEKYVTYPPEGLLPLPGSSVEFDDGCDVWDAIFSAALLVNPAFDIYRIFDTWPILWDVLGFPGSFPQTQVSPLYFNRDDVKAAIHAPLDVDWTECSNVNVFPNGDSSLPPALSVLPSVIERSERAVIVHGLADFILIADGTRIAIQNMTWNGLQGFQTPIQNDSFIVDGMGALGNVHSERGLTYFEVALSGHMIPQFSPVAALQIMQYLMGFRDTP